MPALFNVVAGVHIYVVAPIALSSEDVPLQIVLSAAVAVTVTPGLTVSVTVVIPVQPLLVPVILYVVVAFGNAKGLEIFDWLNPVAGFHE